jgi:HAD superfamily hydrolase (TIGR01458 family)
MRKLEEKFSNVKGILSDIDGTLYFKGKPIPGAIETVSRLHELGLKLLFFTNTDSKSPKTVLKILKEYGFQIKKEEVFTPIIALKEFLTKFPNKKSYFVITKEVEREFQNIPRVKGLEVPDFVIIGDFHDNWDVHRLNEAFKYVFKGASLLGTQGNKYFLDHNGEPKLDTGSFVQMIANATGVTPKIFGKPSKQYFIQALEKINLQASDVIVIGDDIDSDIMGALNSGIKSILVKTGKGQFYDSTKAKIKPYMVVNSFSSILEYI